MASDVDKRHGARVRTRFETLSMADPDPLGRGEKAEQGIAVLTEISYSGARLERTKLAPPLGSHVRVQIFLPGRSGVYFELEGEVVRHLQNGFAIAYDWIAPEIQRLVDDAAALV